MITQSNNRFIKFIISLILTLILTISVMLDLSGINGINTFFVNLFNGNVNSSLGAFFRAIVFIFSPSLDIIWAIVIAFFLWFAKAKVPAIWTICVLLGGDIIAYLVKHIVKEPRPPMHMASDDGYAFPSGHTLGMFIILSIIWIIILPYLKNDTTRKISKIVIVILIILMMIARVYLHAHYFTDTIGSILLGYTWLQVSEWLYLKLAPIFDNFKITKDSYK